MEKYPKSGSANFLFIFGYFLSKKERFSLQSKFYRVILYIGRLSFGIYLIHPFILGKLVRPIIRKIHLLSSNFFVEQFILIALTLIGSIIFIELLRKINKKIAIKYLGF